jgi:hypothetical protein
MRRRDSRSRLLPPIPRKPERDDHWTRSIEGATCPLTPARMLRPGPDYLSEGALRTLARGGCSEDQGEHYTQDRRQRRMRAASDDAAKRDIAREWPRKAEEAPKGADR